MNGKLIGIVCVAVAISMQAATAQECRKVYVNNKPVTICPKKQGPMNLPNPTVPPKKPTSHRA
ncbi:hypothetical protein ACVIHI_008307 [Bradyrhizobium sp. USDA 4524]|uniref:hypothetical protein n=1 Tax=unclassified Bradyrhizobium TaxID=2631580 RepID=UPI00209EE69A|nr:MULTISPECIES: hypothetical protein [unclassified Bradyrhizobium]MCP1838770.1 hypothetical protein [Bradyrhizobium sp. USDA 4538]MCP1899336.1 hypothetical protein [Bradyrhizobium sp. USDA 4537]MCP1986552.1 hypothetical protein [Bradyrhizobium sp. USDA 4539]